jgi:hypothetical protein
VGLTMSISQLGSLSHCYYLLQVIHFQLLVSLSLYGKLDLYTLQKFLFLVAYLCRNPQLITFVLPH